MISFRLSLTPRRRSAEKGTKGIAQSTSTINDCIGSPSCKTLLDTPPTKAAPRIPLASLQNVPSTPSRKTAGMATSPAPKATLGPTMLRSNLTPKGGRGTGHRKTASTATIPVDGSPSSVALPDGSIIATLPPAICDIPPPAQHIPLALAPNTSSTHPPPAIIFKVPQLRISVPLAPALSSSSGYTALSSSSEYTPSTPGSAYTPSFTFSPLSFGFPAMDGASSHAVAEVGCVEESEEEDARGGPRTAGKLAEDVVPEDEDVSEEGRCRSVGPLMMRITQRL